MKNTIIGNLPKKHIRINKFLLTAIGFLIGTSLFAQEVSGQEINNSPPVWWNPIFIALLSVIIILIIVIIALGSVLESVAANSIRKKANGKILGILALVAFMAAGKTTQAQEIISSSDQIPPLNSGLFYLMMVIIGFEILIIIVLLTLLYSFVRKENVMIAKVKPSLLEKLNASVAIEKEEEIMFDHIYDGIRELDNDLPPWWKYGFYLTIICAFSYMIYYHVLNGDLQIAEYNNSMQAAKLAKEEYTKKNADNVNEDNVMMLNDKSEIAKGEKIFKENCFACHGKMGEGGVGPNLTDDYWLHGGSIRSIFSTIKYGWPDKGMKAWQADFSPVQIHQIASYIKTLNGSKPANGKAPQGDLFAELTTSKDSLKTDSIQVVLPKIDSAKAENK